MNDFFTFWICDPVGVILGTGYYRFGTAIGVSGLAQIRHGDDGQPELDILAVTSEQEGKGQFRRFISEAKNRFQKISIWHDDNPLIGRALLRYGFWRVNRTLDGEIMFGWRWEKE